MIATVSFILTESHVEIDSLRKQKFPILGAIKKIFHTYFVYNLNMKNAFYSNCNEKQAHNTSEELYMYQSKNI